MNLIPQRDYVTNTLARAKSPCVLSSFGKDSQLLLHLAREQRKDVPIYFYGDSLPSFAEQFIIDENLTVLNYAPADRYIVPNGAGLALVDEYSLGRVRIPMLSEIVQGENCTHGVSETRTPYFNFAHDLVFYGYKQNESIDAVGTTFEKEISLGNIQLVAPLYEMSDDKVYAALDTLGILYSNESDAVEFCDECLNAILNSDWDQQAALAGFRSRFYLNN